MIGTVPEGSTMSSRVAPDAVFDGASRGLTADDARRLLAEHGPNRLVPTQARGRKATVLVRAASDPMAILLLIAAPTYLALGERVDALVTFLALAPITAVGVALETRAEDALARLAALVTPTAQVVRDGAPVTIDVEEIVPGDRLVVREGDVVPADAEVAAGGPIIVDESALSGESAPVAKGLGGDTSVFAGTTVVTGRAYATVGATGPATRYGRIGAHAA
jgi:P-type Ca2+ transporter type 2C